MLVKIVFIYLGSTVFDNGKIILISFYHKPPLVSVPKITFCQVFYWTSMRMAAFVVSLFGLLFVPDLDTHEPGLPAKSCIKQRKALVAMVTGALCYEKSPIVRRRVNGKNSFANARTLS